LHYALSRKQLVPAQTAIKKAESYDTTSKRTFLVAQSAVLALENRKAEALAKIEELDALLGSLPEWDTQWGEEHDRITAVRALLDQA